MMTQEELEHRINKMSEEEQQHFKLLIYKLVMCYGEGQAQGVATYVGGKRFFRLSKRPRRTTQGEL